MESCADTEVDVGVRERLIEPEEEKVCLRYILKQSTRRGGNLFKFFDTRLEHPRERVAMQGGQMSGMTLSIKEQWQKPRRALKGRRCHSKARR